MYFPSSLVKPNSSQVSLQITLSGDVQPGELASVIFNDQGREREFASPLGQFLLKGLTAGMKAVLHPDPLPAEEQKTEATGHTQES